MKYYFFGWKVEAILKLICCSVIVGSSVALYRDFYNVNLDRRILYLVYIFSAVGCLYELFTQAKPWLTSLLCLEMVVLSINIAIQIVTRLQNNDYFSPWVMTHLCYALFCSYISYACALNIIEKRRLHQHPLPTIDATLDSKKFILT